MRLADWWATCCREVVDINIQGTLVVMKPVLIFSPTGSIVGIVVNNQYIPESVVDITLRKNNT